MAQIHRFRRCSNFFRLRGDAHHPTETLRNWGDRKSNPIIYGLLDCALDCRRAVPSRRQTTVTLLDEWKDSVELILPQMRILATLRSVTVKLWPTK